MISEALESIDLPFNIDELADEQWVELHSWLWKTLRASGWNTIAERPAEGFVKMQRPKK